MFASLILEAAVNSDEDDDNIQPIHQLSQILSKKHLTKIM